MSADQLSNIARLMVEEANAQRRAIERLHRKERRAREQCRFTDSEALMRGRLALLREMRITQEIVADACAPWFEVRA